MIKEKIHARSILYSYYFTRIVTVNILLEIYRLPLKNKPFEKSFEKVVKDLKRYGHILSAKCEMNLKINFNITKKC